MMVVWHVDNLKVSHSQMSVVEDFISQMDAEYGQENASHCVSQSHNYLGMTLNFLEPHCIIIQMSDYVKTML